MATSLTVSEMTARIRIQYSSGESIAQGTIDSTLAMSLNLINGTGAAGTADRVYVKRHSINASSSTDLDLAASLTDAFGTTITFARIKAMFFFLQPSPAAASILIGGHATASFTNWITGSPDMDTAQPKIRVRNGTLGGFFTLATTDATAYVVTATTNDILTVANADAGLAATVDVVLVGSTA